MTLFEQNNPQPFAAALSMDPPKSQLFLSFFCSLISTPYPAQIPQFMNAHRSFIQPYYNRIREILQQMLTESSPKISIFCHILSDLAKFEDISYVSGLFVTYQNFSGKLELLNYIKVYNSILLRSPQSYDPQHLQVFLQYVQYYFQQLQQNQSSIENEDYFIDFGQLLITVCHLVSQFRVEFPTFLVSEFLIAFFVSIPENSALNFFYFFELLFTLTAGNQELAGSLILALFKRLETYFASFIFSFTTVFLDQMKTLIEKARSNHSDLFIHVLTQYAQNISSIASNEFPVVLFIIVSNLDHTILRQTVQNLFVQIIQVIFSTGLPDKPTDSALLYSLYTFFKIFHLLDDKATTDVHPIIAQIGDEILKQIYDVFLFRYSFFTDSNYPNGDTRSRGIFQLLIVSIISTPNLSNSMKNALTIEKFLQFVQTEPLSTEFAQLASYITNAHSDSNLLPQIFPYLISAFFQRCGQDRLFGFKIVFSYIRYLALPPEGSFDANVIQYIQEGLNDQNIVESDEVFACLILSLHCLKTRALELFQRVLQFCESPTVKPYSVAALLEVAAFINKTATESSQNADSQIRHITSREYVLSVAPQLFRLYQTSITFTNHIDESDEEFAPLVKQLNDMASRYFSRVNSTFPDQTTFSEFSRIYQ